MEDQDHLDHQVHRVFQEIQDNPGLWDHWVLPDNKVIKVYPVLRVIQVQQGRMVLRVQPDLPELLE